MNFALPASGEGPSVEATVGGMEVVYPLGPLLWLAWAYGTVQTAVEQTRIYRSFIVAV
jgi:hypothetical protein